ncbi:MAG TPA: hypothetical protein VEO95_12845 [Chthoniobacteraceae bacterium]|nr:hypothetical protein [Chthoniobacteraceae bacterium]
MKRISRKHAVLAGSLVLALAGCAQQEADTSFTIRKIESVPNRRDGTVSVKLTTPGEVAEADESSIVQFVQIVAVREATARQRQLAAARARATFRKIAAQPAASHPRKARFLAVKTEPSAPEPKARTHAAASVMIWDTQTQEIVGNKVYDVRSEPVAGSVAHFDTFTAEYVGSGL